MKSFFTPHRICNSQNMVDYSTKEKIGWRNGKQLENFNRRSTDRPSEKPEIKWGFEQWNVTRKSDY